MSTLIGKGAYGCVITPPILKSKIITEFTEYKNPNKKDVVKLFKNGYNDFKEEYNFTKILNIVDSEHNYSVEMKGAYKKENKNLEEKIYKCVKKTEYYEIIYENGGIPLENLKYKISLYDFIKKFEILINGLDILHTKGHLHRDLKPDNILINKSKMSLIDFGLSIYKKDTYNSENIRFLTHYYPYYPPEFMVMYHVLKKKKDILKKCKDDYENKNNNFSLFQNLEAYEKYEKGSINKDKRYKELRELLEDKNYEKIITENVEKVDIYSIGIILSIIEKNINFNNSKEKEIYNTIIENCINFNVKKRWSIENIIKYINKNKNEINDINEIKKIKKVKKIKPLSVKIEYKEKNKNLRKLIQKFKLI